jgi:hypothetical protein
MGMGWKGKAATQQPVGLLHLLWRVLKEDDGD